MAPFDRLRRFFNVHVNRYFLRERLFNLLPLGKNSIVSSYLLMGTVFLAVAVTLGILLGFVLAHGMLSIDIDAWVKAHVIGTLFGFVMMIVMGVSMVLIPMFSLAHGFKDRYIHAALFLHGIGVSVAILALVAALPTVVFYAGIGSVFISMGLYLFQMGIIFSVRVRKQNDYWVKNLFFSFLSLLGAMVMLLLFFIEAQERYLFAAAELFFLRVFVGVHRRTFIQDFAVFNLV
ncbi:MAG: hypothetical protein LRY52_10300 [Sulfurospirillum cavolei]|nr:hypothetical protein [Sulfurospirillum cavolei]